MDRHVARWWRVLPDAGSCAADLPTAPDGRRATTPSPLTAPQWGGSHRRNFRPRCPGASSGPHAHWDLSPAGGAKQYQLPARCFAYVGSADQPGTWKLPYLLADGSLDLKRLPKAIQAILSNYRGVKVSMPREAVADVLVRLGITVASIGRMPCQCNPTADAYSEAHEALDQLGRLGDVGCCG